MSKMTQNIAAKVDAAKATTNKLFNFMTAKSKKITIALIFLISVVCDEVLWDNALYPHNDILKSNVFIAFVLILVAVLTKDVQALIHAFVEKKIIGGKLPPSDETE